MILSGLFNSKDGVQNRRSEARLVNKSRDMETAVTVLIDFYVAKPGFSPFSASYRPFGALQTHLCLRPLQKPASGHPDIGQRKQRFRVLLVTSSNPVRARLICFIVR